MSLYFEELVNLAQVDPLFGVQLVDVTHIPVHQVQTEAHHLSPAWRQDVVEAQDRWRARGQAAGCVDAWVEKSSKKKKSAPTLSSMCFSLGVRYILFS